jgi:uncharacterized protein
MDIEQWTELFDGYLAKTGGTDAAHDVSHLRRVARTALAIAMREKANTLVVLAASYFHDIVNLPKNHPERNGASILAARRTLEIFEAEFPAFPSQLYTNVAHAIEAHSFSAGIEPRSLEARIVQDADRLEALGAVGIARVFYIAGKLEQALFDDTDLLARHRTLDDKAFAIDHFQVKLLRLHKTMKTSTGMSMARENAKYMIHFLSKLSAEIKGDMLTHDFDSTDFLLQGL